MNKKEIEIKVTNHTYSDLIKILINKKIYYKDLNINENEITFKTNKEDYKILKKILKSVKITKYLGIDGIKEFIKKHWILLASFIITYIMLIILSNIIFDVQIITNNYELKRIINLYLEDYDIKKYKFIKSNKELTKIKEEILKENKTTLEWIEIERIGTTYIINLTERVINENNLDTIKSDIVASKDAMIMYIITKNGTKLKEINEIVKKGETIISGNITKDEDVVDTVRAKGEVYGEVWYTVTSTVPYNHTEYEKTGEKINHIYIDLFGKKITLMGKYDTKSSMNNTKVLIDKPYLFFKVMKEEKELYKYVNHKLTEKEAYEEAIKRADKSIEAKLEKGEYIINKKVLKNNTYSSKIELEIFYRVYESIGEEKEIIVPETEGE
jgi:similar to stage IV sporulation protein